jgi:acyl-CoA thioesterase-1
MKTVQRNRHCGSLRFLGASLSVVAITTLALMPFAAPALAQPSGGKPVKIVALGDSLTAGYGLPASAAFPVRLAAALKASGHNVEIVNAGVSGDTSAGGLERLDWAVPKDADAVIVELGANDMLRGIDPKITRKNIDTIVSRLRERHQQVLVAGMMAAPNLGKDYGGAYNAIFAEVAKAHDALYYPFFLNGIVGDAKLNQKDGLHPTAEGVDIIVKNILPSVEELIARVAAQAKS